jgi:Transposase DDE domain/Transposase domain (DUF772)
MSKNSKGKGSRPRRRLPNTLPPGEAPAINAGVPAVDAHFECGRDDADIRIGGVPLLEYLEDCEMSWVIDLWLWMHKLDLSALLARYSPRGRKPNHPRIMLGLILYGMQLRQWSLRELEVLARRDVGAWLMCGGIQPDHSTLCDFINLHRETFEDANWCAGIFRQIASELGLKPGVLAIDGTVVESAASHLKLLSTEAAREAAAKAMQRARDAPGDAQLQVSAKHAEDVATAVEERSIRRAEKDGSREGSCIAPCDPDAVVQPRKDGVIRPSFKPSIGVIEGRFIVGLHVDPSNETSAVPLVIRQHQKVFGRSPSAVLLDAGYFCASIFVFAVADELNVLCPSGRALKDDEWEKNSQNKHFPKRLFVYQNEEDRYRCPAGHALELNYQSQDRHGNPTRTYLCRQCADCALREQCTDAKHGRTIKRYDGDELKEAMLELMRHPLAREQYKRRSAIVEPVFAELRERQNLRRFHRRGLRGARVEFSLHCLAFNLKRAGRLQAAVRILVLLFRLPDSAWRLAFVAAWINPEVLPNY